MPKTTMSIPANVHGFGEKKLKVVIYHAMYPQLIVEVDESALTVDPATQDVLITFVTGDLRRLTPPSGDVCES